MEMANAKKFEMQVESIQEVQFEEVKKSFAGLANREDIQLDPDLMYAKFIMCHEGVNANGDTFTKDVLQRAQYTPRFKPIDWEHGQPFIGTILDSQYSETDEGVGYIEAIGAIWKFHYPDLAEKIKEKSEDGGLRLSMECFYRDANYQYGDQLYTQEQADSLGLTDYVGRAYMGKKVCRVFSDVIFGGVGVVANPADKDAVFLSVAKKKIEAEETELAIADLHPTNDFADKVMTKDTFSAVTIAKYVKAFDNAKSSIVSKFNKNKVATKDQVILEVRQVLNQLVGDIRVIERDYYKGKADDDSYDLDLINYDDFVNQDQADVDQDISKEDADHLDDRNEMEGKKSKALTNNETVEDDLTDPNDDLNDMVDDYNPYKEDDKKMAKDLPKDHLENHDDMEPELAENKKGENPELDSKADNKLPSDHLDNHDGEDPVLADDNMEDSSDASKKDPDNDGDDDTTPEGDTDHDKFPAKKKSKADKRIAELESALANMEAKFDALMEKVEAGKKKALASQRMAELAEIGIEFSEARKVKEVEKVSAMNNSDYEDYKAFLCEIAGVKVEKAEAGIVVEEVTVEDIDVASAGLNVETEVPKLIKPFGHLVD
jgi:hypothetical protein